MQRADIFFCDIQRYVAVWLSVLRKSLQWGALQCIVRFNQAHYAVCAAYAAGSMSLHASFAFDFYQQLFLIVPFAAQLAAQFATLFVAQFAAQ